MRHEQKLPIPLVVLAGVAVCTLFFFILFLVDEVPPEDRESLQNTEQNFFEEGITTINAPVQYKTKTYNVKEKSIDTFWHDVDNPQGIIFLFHGCSHSGSDWFTLPEEVKLVKEAITLKLLPVSFSSSEAKESQAGGCWDHMNPYQIPDIARRNKDLAPIGDLITELIANNNWNHLPITLLGTSSGAMFSSMIPIQLPEISFKALMLYISPGITKIFDDISLQDISVHKFPRVGFVAMERDQQTLQAMQNAESVLKRKGVTTQFWSVGRPRIYSEFFSDELPLTTAESEELFFILLDHSLLDNKGFLDRNPKATRLIELLFQEFSQPQLLSAHLDSLTELMNVAFGFHEFTSAHAIQIIRWCRSLK